METASPTLFFPPTAAPGYGAVPPASRVATAIAARRAYGPPLDPAASTAPHRAVGTGRRTAPARPNRTALGSYQDQTPTNKVSTVSGDCHHRRQLACWVPLIVFGDGWAKCASKRTKPARCWS